MKLGQELLNTGAKQPAQDDFLNRVNTTIGNFNKLMETAAKFRGATAPHQEDTPAQNSGAQALATQAQEAARAAAAAQESAKAAAQAATKLQGTPAQEATPGEKFITIFLKSGYGDKPITELLTEIGPFTVRQIIEVVKNGRIEEKN